MKLVIYLSVLLLTGLAIGPVCQLIGHLPMMLALFLAPLVAVLFVYAAWYGLVWFFSGERPVIPRLARRDRSIVPELRL